MSALRNGAADYLQLRRGLGFKLNGVERRLRLFIAFMKRRKVTTITTKLALSFAQEPRLSPPTMAQRLGTVRGFARFQCASDPATEVPPNGLMPFRARPARPYLYTEREIRDLLDAVSSRAAIYRRGDPWRHRLQRCTMRCVFGLLAVSGMRIGEVLNLTDGDVNWTDDTLTVRKGKFGKSRVVPLHRSTVVALKAFVAARNKLLARHRPDIAPLRLFVTKNGRRVYVQRVNAVFLRLSRQLGWRAVEARGGPRIHDFRHRFAIETLLHWYRSGQDAERLLPVLSTYLGHGNVSNTYWYLRCTPELMAAACGRLERWWKGIK